MTGECRVNRMTLVSQSRIWTKTAELRWGIITRIPNTKFHIWWASDNTTTGELNDLGTYYTDENGEIILTGDALDRGWYKVTEEAPAAGFAPADEPTQEFYLAGNENAVKIWENRPLSALVLFKYDEKTGAALQGAEFTVRYRAAPPAPAAR